MFGWFTPKCPVEAGMKRWIEARTGWLLGQFDKKRTLYTPMILPNEEFYPDPYDGSEEAGRMLFKRTCEYMNYDSGRVELKFYRPERKGRFNASLIVQRPGWAGLYGDDEESQKTIWIDSALLEDAEGLVATFAHELAHAILLGEKRLSRDVPDMESITDLATVILGMGIFNANVSFRTKNYSAMRMHYSSISRIGYLVPEAYGYALSIFAWLREEENPAWIRYLGTPVCSPCKQGLSYLRETRDAQVVIGEPLDAISLSDLFPNISNDTESCSDNDKRLEAEFQTAEESATEEDRHFADGFAFADNGQWQEAADAYSKVIECTPLDGEAYQERAWAYLELGKIAEAVTDAEKAVELLPEESGVYLLRGTAYTQSKKYDQAISDLDRYIEDVGNFSGDGLSSTKGHYFRGLAYSGEKRFQKSGQGFFDGDYSLAPAGPTPMKHAPTPTSNSANSTKPKPTTKRPFGMR